MGDVTLLVTNGGPHPSDKWAALAANKIADLVQIDENSSTELAAAARKSKPRFAIALADVLEPVFDDVMGAERSGVDAGTITLRHQPFSVDAFIDGAVRSIADAATETPFSGHYADHDVQFVIRNILKQHFIDAANIQRSWSLDSKGL